jgi:hypothetical protein
VRTVPYKTKPNVNNESIEEKKEGGTKFDFAEYFGCVGGCEIAVF